MKRKLAKKRPTFNPQNVEYLADPFIDKDLVKRVFYSIFNDRRYAPGTLIKLDKRGLEAILREISAREDVRRFQRTIDAEVSSGERSLVRLAGDIFDKIISQKGLEGKIYEKEYQEVTATCINCESKVATGLFASKVSEDDVLFIPEQVLYAKNLVGIFPNGGINCSNCGEHELLMERTAWTYLYKDRVRDKNQELEKRTKIIIRDVFKNIPSKFSDEHNQQKRYNLMEKYIVDGFHRMFKSVKIGNQVNYPKLYKLFEWVRRENFNIEQLEWIDNETRRELANQISKHIPLPYAVIRTRVKRKERMYEKVLQVLYNLKKSKSTKRKTLDDIYGLRVIVPKEEDCYTLIPLLKSLSDDPDRIRIKDKIKTPEKRAEGIYYKGLHLYIPIAKMTFEVQVKTHSMDREAESHPAIAHEEGYVADTRDIINKIPHQIRAVVAAVIGVRPPVYTTPK